MSCGIGPDVAQILPCCGCGVSSGCSSDLTPSLGTSMCQSCSPKKKKKEKKKESDCISSSCCRGTGSIPSPVQWIKVSGVAIAVAQVVAEAQIQSLAWELPYTMGVAIKLKQKVTMVEKCKNRGGRKKESEIQKERQ